MTDWSGTLARAFQRHIEIAGDGGSDGSQHEIPKEKQTLGLETSQRTTSLGALVPSSGTTGTTATAKEVPRHLAEEGQHGTRGINIATTHGAPVAFEVDAFEERAAIVEHGASVPRGWAEGFARLDLAEPPSAIDPQAWRQLIDDGGRFLDRWGSEADRLGWSALDVFGVHPVEARAGYDAVGLVLLISGGEVVAIGANRATIRTSAGTLLTFLRRTQAGAVAVWDLIDPEPRATIQQSGKETDHA